MSDGHRFARMADERADREKREMEERLEAAQKQATEAILREQQAVDERDEQRALARKWEGEYEQLSGEWASRQDEETHDLIDARAERDAWKRRALESESSAAKFGSDVRMAITQAIDERDKAQAALSDAVAVGLGFRGERDEARRAGDHQRQAIMVAVDFERLRKERDKLLVENQILKTAAGVALGECHIIEQQLGAALEGKVV